MGIFGPDFSWTVEDHRIPYFSRSREFRNAKGRFARANSPARRRLLLDNTFNRRSRIYKYRFARYFRLFPTVVPFNRLINFRASRCYVTACHLSRKRGTSRGKRRNFSCKNKKMSRGYVIARLFKKVGRASEVTFTLNDVQRNAVI